MQKKIFYIACAAILILNFAILGFTEEMQSSNYKIPTSVFSNGGAPAGSSNFKTDSTLGQSSPLMEGVQNPFSSNYEIFPGFWHTMEISDGSPIPDIKANNSDGPVDLNNGEDLSITIDLDPGDYADVQADWWCVADTPFG